MPMNHEYAYQLFHHNHEHSMFAIHICFFMFVPLTFEIFQLPASNFTNVYLYTLHMLMMFQFTVTNIWQPFFYFFPYLYQ